MSLLQITILTSLMLSLCLLTLFFWITIFGGNISISLNIPWQKDNLKELLKTQQLVLLILLTNEDLYHLAHITDTEREDLYEYKQQNSYYYLELIHNHYLKETYSESLDAAYEDLGPYLKDIQYDITKVIKYIN